MKQVVALLIIVLLGGILAIVVSDMPDFGSEKIPSNNRVSKHYINESEHEVEALNIVNAIVVDYRGYDTLIETFVLFTISISVISLFDKGKVK